MASTSAVDSLPLFFFASSVFLSLMVRAYKNICKQKQCDSTSYKLIALDLDGTTLNSNHVITEPTAEKLRSLSAKGIQIAIATGRSLGAVRSTLNTLQLGVEVPVVCLNGAMCIKMSKDVQAFEKIFDAFVPPSSADKLLAFASRLGVVAQYYIDSEVFAAPETAEHHELLEKYAVLTGRKQQLVADYGGLLNGNATAAKILLMTNDTDGLISTAIGEGLDKEFHLIKGSPYPFFVEFLAPGINKGTGLQKMCSILTYDMTKVVAFGDGDNDKEFLEFAGLGVAMNNAKSVAKEAADVINPWTNDEDGVARYLGQLEQRGLL